MNRVYQHLLRAYPQDYATAHGGELLATREQSSHGKLLAREVIGLLLGAIRQRHLSDRVRSRRLTVVLARPGRTVDAS
jgi:hypothetical protein